MQKKPKKPIIFWYLIGMAVVFLFNLFVFPLMGNQITEVDYGTFLRRVESGVVEKVEMTDTEIGFIVKDSDKAYDSVVLSVIKDAYQRAMDILEENKAKLHQLAQHLLENETISGEEFTSLLSI